jgi:4-hydroxyphenylacetate 3-monooxygenase
MGIRRGSEFLAGIQDDREVWLDGKRVENVTTHPDFAGCARALAELYDLQHDPAFSDLLTIPSPTTGDRVSRGYTLPGTADDLRKRREMIEWLMRRTGGTAGRLPEYMASIVVGLYDVRGILAQVDPGYADNAAAYLEFVRENDLSLTHSFADAPHDARIPREGFENLRTVEERPDGIVIRGVKSVATLAPFADEYLALAPNRPGLDSSEIVYFAVPVATRGLRMYCRPSLVHSDAADHRLSASFDEMDAWVVFDDVFVPNERVFYLQRTEVHRDLFQKILSWAFYHILIRMACKAEVLAGIGAAVSDYLGKDQQPQIQVQLCELIGYVETLRAFLCAAEADPVRSESGFLVPNPKQITLGRIFAVDQHPRVLQIVRELCGSGILMAPGEPEMDNPDIAADVERYLAGPDRRSAERFRLLKLAWEYACDSFGSRQLLFEMHNAGAQLATQQRLVSIYDKAPLVELAKELAGISPGAPEGIWR